MRQRWLGWMLVLSLLVSICLHASGDQPAPAAGARTDFYGDPLPDGAIARLGSTRWRPGDECILLAFHSDGKSLLTVDRSSGACVWDVATGKKLRESGPFPGTLRCAAASADGAVVALAGEGPPKSNCNQFWLWNTATGKEVARFVEPDTSSIDDIVAGLAISPDGNQLAARYFCSTAITIWDIPTGKRVSDLGKRKETESWVGPVLVCPQSLAFTSDGKSLIAGSETDECCTWEIATGKQKSGLDGKLQRGGFPSSLALASNGPTLAWLRGHQVYVGTAASWQGEQWAKVPDGSYFVMTIALSPSRRLLAAATDDAQIFVWNLTDSKLVKHVPPLEHALSHRPSIAISPDDTTVAVSVGPCLRLVNLASGKELTTERGHNSVFSAALAPDGKTVVTHGYDSTRRIWDATTGRELKRVALANGPDWGPPIFSPTQALFASSFAGNQLWLVDADTGQSVRTLDPPLRSHALGGILALHVSPAPANVLDGIVLARAATMPPDWIGEIRGFSANGQRLRASLQSGAIAEWDVKTGKLVAMRTERVPFGEICARAYDGGLAAFAGTVQEVGDQRELGVYDLRKDKELWRVRTKDRIWQANSSAHGKVLTVVLYRGEDGSAKLFEVHTGKVRRQFSEQQQAVAATLSGDCRLLAVTTAEGQVQIYDVAEARKVHVFKPHASGLRHLEFSRDSKQLLTCGNDCTALLWDLATLAHLRPSNPPELTPPDLERLWIDLASDHVDRAFDAILKLTAVPRQALEFLKARLKPVARLEPARLDELIGLLRSDVYLVRQTAISELEQLGELAEPALRKALVPGIMLEQKQRIDLLLKKVEQRPLSPTQIQQLRALEVLELIATPEAFAVLEPLAGGEPKSRLTQDAQRALAGRDVR
jgi:WD40 repeat protein